MTAAIKLCPQKINGLRTSIYKLNWTEKQVLGHREETLDQHNIPLPISDKWTTKWPKTKVTSCLWESSSL